MKSRVERIDPKGPDQRRKWSELSMRLLKDSKNTSLRLMLLAAHPDDETIGASALLAQFPKTVVAFLTDGAPRDTRFWPSDMSGSRQKYAELRRRETANAFRHARISETPVWLGGTDQETVFQIQMLTSKLRALLDKTGIEAIVTHPYEGGHPDHDSAALIARLAISRMRKTPRPELLEMTSYHAHNKRCVTGEFLPEKSVGQKFDPLIFDLNECDRERKQKMMAAYRSQRAVLEGFRVDREMIRLAPDYDFSRPPHEGKLCYECMGWPINGARWREIAAITSAATAEKSCA